MATTVSVTQAYDLLIDCIKAKLVPMLTGSPGSGKSSIVHQIADEFNLQLIDLRLSQCDPTDLLGFPHVDKDTGKASYMPMSTFPLEDDKEPEGKNGWLLFLDEFNSAPMSVQAAAYKLTLDRQIGEYKLNKHCAVVCAGNLSTDNAIVNRMSTAMQSRLVHLEMEVDLKSWMEWAIKAGIDYRIRAYLNYVPSKLYNFDPQHNDKTFACSRTWEFCSRLIKGWKKIPYEKLPLLAGTISEGVATEFLGFCEIFESLPTIQQIIKDPESIDLSHQPDVLYAMTGMIGNHFSEDNAESLIKFVNRLPAEFQVIALREIVSKGSVNTDHPVIREWIVKNATALM